MNEPKQKLPQVVNVLLVTALTTAVIVGFGEYLFWTKPLSDALTKSQKEAVALNETLQAVISAASKNFLTYENADYGFSFQYPEGYEIVTANGNENAPEGSIAYLSKKDSHSVVAWIAIRPVKDAIVPETHFQDKVVKSETSIGKENIAATSLSLLPGRGNEFGSSVHITHIIVPLKKSSDNSVVLTNIGDNELAAFQLALASFEIK